MRYFIVGRYWAVTCAAFFVYGSAGGVVAANPVPFVNNPLVPTSTRPGSGPFTLTVNGANFVSGATVYWNGSARATTFVGPTQVTANILAADVATSLTAEIEVGNPGTVALSNTSYFSVSRATDWMAKPMSFAVAPEPISYFSSRAAVGDFNGDGKVDLAGIEVGTFGETLNILLGDGDGTFQPPISYALGSSSYSIYGIGVADINNDGKLDLVLLGLIFGAESSVMMTPMLGNGDGTFLPQPGIALGESDYPPPVAIGDFNRDGNIDVATANSDSGVYDVVLLFGKGDGTFQPYVEIPTFGSRPTALSAGDFNRDGILDLAALFQDGYQVLTGQGNGGFVAGNPVLIEAEYLGIAAGDINGDAITDLVTVGGGGMSPFYGVGDGTFRAAGSAGFAPREPYSVALGDLNADNKLDIVTSDLEGGGDILMNQSGTPVPVAAYGDPQSVQVVMADFNSDGKLDFVLPNAGVYLSTEVSLSPNSLAFTSAVGFPGTPQAATLTNASHNSIYVGAIQFSGANAEDFSQANNCGSRLAAGASCTITITFIPVNDGSNFSASMSVPEGASMQSIALSGSATGSAPVVQLSSKSLSWGSQPVGQPGATASVKLTNIGNASLTSLSVAVTGANASDFAITSNNCRATLKESASCVVSVVFTPGATGARTASLAFTDSAFGSPQTVALSGAGI